MVEWREKIFAKIRYAQSDRVLIIDQEGILADEELLNAVKNVGFDFLIYDDDTDSIDFRYRYEKNFRKAWDNGIRKRLLLIFQKKSAEKKFLPYDMIYNAETIYLDFSDIATCIDIDIMRLLNHDQYDILCAGIDYEYGSHPKEMTKQESLLFVLRTVFRIHLIEIRTDVDFACLLFNIHYGKVILPEELVDHISSYLTKQKKLSDWKFKDMLSNSLLFWEYIQRLWDKRIQYTVYYDYLGPEDLNILDIRLVIFLDNAFSDGHLLPRVISEAKYSALANTIPLGLLGAGTIKESEDSEYQNRHRKQLSEKLSSTMITTDSTYRDWINLNDIYTQWLNIIESSGDDCKEDLQLRENLNAEFTKWLSNHFDSIFYETTAYPLLVFKILSFLTKRMRQNGNKIALIVLDGMSYPDWITIRQNIKFSGKVYKFEEHTCFALLPTLTSVSRQAIFSGKLPRDFAKTIRTTNAEESEWQAAWLAGISSLKSSDIVYIRNYKGENKAYFSSLISNAKVVGMVINAVDDLIHGSEVLGSKGLHIDIKTWLERGLLAKTISELYESGFNVFITTDHGNTYAKGIGVIREGVLAEDKGQRARVYPNDILRDASKNNTDNCMEWNSSILPEDYKPLLANYGKAFIDKKSTIMTHGGTSLEEVLIPFIEVKP